MENNPLFLYKVIEQDGRKTGYLVYNEFKAGINDGDASYLEQMLQIFQWFKQQGVTDFILDLRYNQGGQVTCAQLLASLLAPAGSLGQEFARFEFNDKRQDSNYSLNFLTEYANYNLNLDRLFIISGLYTASASEMMVNCLRPYMTVNLLGTKTLGKNVAMTRIDSPYGFVMYPVTSTVLNKEGQSDYANGFTPEYIISELNYYPWYELGDPNELLLKNALQWMAGGVPSDAENVSKPEEPETPESPASPPPAPQTGIRLFFHPRQKSPGGNLARIKSCISKRQTDDEYFSFGRYPDGMSGVCRCSLGSTYHQYALLRSAMGGNQGVPNRLLQEIHHGVHQGNASYTSHPSRL